MNAGKIFIGIVTVASMTASSAMGMDALHNHSGLLLALGLVNAALTAVIAVFGKPLAGVESTKGLQLPEEKQ